MNPRRVYVIGSGGHAKVVTSLLACLNYKVAAIYDDDPTRWERSLLGVPVTGPIERLEQASRLPTVIAIGHNQTRAAVANRLQLEWLTAVHPRAHVDCTANLGEGAVVMAGAVIQPDARLGRHVIVNTGASVDHDCVVGDFAHIAPGARLAGSVVIESGVLFGIGAVAIPGVQIGSWTTVGAGAAVVADVPGQGIAKGVPARFELRTRHPRPSTLKRK